MILSVVYRYRKSMSIIERVVSICLSVCMYVCLSIYLSLYMEFLTSYFSDPSRCIWKFTGWAIIEIKYKKRTYISSVNKLNCQLSFVSSSQRANCYKYIPLLNMDAKLGSQILKQFVEWSVIKLTEKHLVLRGAQGSKLLPHLVGNQSFTQQVECRWIIFYQCMLTGESQKISYIGKRSLDNAIGCLGKKNIIYIRNKFDRNPLYCK